MAKGDTFKDLAQQRRNEDRSGANVQAYSADESWLDVLESAQSQELMHAGGQIQLGDFKFSATSIDIPDGTTPEQWRNLYNVIMAFDSSIQWYIGEAIVHGEAKLGMTYEQMAEGTSYTPDALKNIAYVVRNVKKSFRHDALSFTHHQIVAPLEKAKQKEALDIAAIGDGKRRWSVQKLREYVYGKKSNKTPKQVRYSRELAKLDLRQNMSVQNANAQRNKIAVIRQWLDTLEKKIDELEQGNK